MKLSLGVLLGCGLVAASGCASPDPDTSGGFGSDDDGRGVAVAHDSGGGDVTVGPGAPDSGADAHGLDAAHAPDTSSNGVDSGHDAGHDGGQQDGGLDAGADAAIDGETDGATDAIAPADSGDVDADAAPIDAGPTPDPIGKWSFEEGTGTTSADLSGHGHAATLLGAASWTASGKVGSGLALDGATGYADVGTTLVDTTKSFTVACWVSLSAVNAWEAALSEDDVNGSLFGLKLRGDGSNAFDFDVETSDVMSPGFVVSQSTTLAKATTWTHLAGVYDPSGNAGGGVLALYVNGAPEAKTAVGQALAGAKGHFLIGRGLYNGAVGSFVNGVIDEVGVYDVALTDAQVAALYAATK